MRKTGEGACGRPSNTTALYGTLDEGCARWGVGKTKLNELIRNGLIRAVRVGKRPAVEFRSGDAYFDSLPAIGRQRAA